MYKIGIITKKDKFFVICCTPALAGKLIDKKRHAKIIKELIKRVPSFGKKLAFLKIFFIFIIQNLFLPPLFLKAEQGQW